MTAARGPAYKLEELVAACGAHGAVVVGSGALDTAQSDFGLRTEVAVRDFINAGGIEKPGHLNTTLWEKNPNPNNPIWVDSYQFFSGDRFGYLAFFRGAKGTWIIKSLKKNEQPDPRFFTMRDALAKFKLGGG